MTKTANNSPKLAYVVKFDDEMQEIVFATSSVAARRMGAREMDVEFSEVTSCCRHPEFDKYAERGEVEPRVLIEEHHYRFECGGCFDDVDDLVEGRCYDDCGAPYCSAECLAASTLTA